MAGPRRSDRSPGRSTWPPHRARYPPDVLILAGDDELRGEVVATLAEKGEYRLRQQRTSEAALEEFREYPPDLLILALQEGTLAFLDRLQRAQPDLAGAVLTIVAPEHMPDLAAARRRGLRHFLFQPFVPAQLVLRVDAALRSLHLERRLEASGRIGGDYFDVLELEDGATGLMIADVVGHGIAAALFTGLLRAMLLHPDLPRRDPSAVLEEANALLEAVFRGSGRFVTALYATVRPTEGRLRLATAGHPDPILLPAGGPPRRLEGTGLPLGIRTGSAYPALELAFRREDRLYLFTDGLLEQRWHGKGRAFGRARLEELVVATRAVPVEASVERVMEELRDWCGQDRFDDDVNLLAAECHGGTEEPPGDRGRVGSR